MEEVKRMSLAQKKMFDLFKSKLGINISFSELVDGFDSTENKTEIVALLRVKINRLRQVIPTEYSIFSKRWEGYVMYKND